MLENNHVDHIAEECDGFELTLVPKSTVYRLRRWKNMKMPSSEHPSED
jgi:hypothetical protein